MGDGQAGAERISDSVVKTLFALSRNRCAFQDVHDGRGCEEKLTDPAWTQVLGEIAHIRGRRPGSARYEASYPQVNGYENLILLCPNHHTVIDRLDPESYTVVVLEEMKHRNENRGDAEFADGATVEVVAAQLIFNAEVRWISEDWTAERLKQLMAEAVDGMPEREKLVLTLNHYEGLTNEEIARVLDVQPSTVQEIHRRAVLSVGKALDLETLTEMEGLAHFDGATRSLIDDLRRFGGR